MTQTQIQTLTTPPSSRALRAVIRELDRSIVTCNALIRDNRWRLLQDIAARRMRAAATMRAMLRWYGERPAPFASETDAPQADLCIGDMLDSDRDLIAAYADLDDAAHADAPEARLVAEQLVTLRAEHEELSRIVSQTS